MLKKLLSCLAIVALSSSMATAGVTIKRVYVTKDRLLTPADKPRMGSFGSPSVNDFGEVAVACSLFGPLTFNNTSLGVVFGKKVPTSVLVARRGDFPVTEIQNFTDNLTFPNSRLIDIDDFTILTNKREVAFSGIVRGNVLVNILDGVVIITGNYIGVASPNYPLPRMVAFGSSQEEVSSFVQPQFAFTEINTDFDLNKKGNIAFAGTSVLSNPNGEWEGVWFGRPAAATSAAPSTGNAGARVVVGEVVHGLPFNSDYFNFGGVALSNANKLYTIATITNKGAGFYGIWAGTTGFMGPVVTRLTRKPENPDLRFGSFSPPITSSRKGKVLTFTADGSLWMKKNKALKEVAKAGDIVGNESSDETKNEKLSGFLTGAAVNSKGRIAFLSRTTLDKETQTALIVSVGHRKFVKVARVGDMMSVKGRSKEIINLELNVRGGLNELGVVAFTASFIDRTSGVFLARVR